VVLQDARYDGIIAFDVKAPRTDDPKHIKDVLEVSGNNLVWLWERALEVDRTIIAGLRSEHRATAIAGYLAKCLYGR
jgi:hypothetical protein